jgi:uncharacterized protein
MPMSRLLSISDVIAENREQILAVCAHYGAFNVRVFGSFARGEATQDSDLDLVVSVPASTSMFDLVELWVDLNSVMPCSVDVLTDLDAESNPFKQAILKEAVPL